MYVSDVKPEYSKIGKKLAKNKRSNAAESSSKHKISVNINNEIIGAYDMKKKL
jgi:hypothetical protein